MVIRIRRPLASFRNVAAVVIADLEGIENVAGGDRFKLVLAQLKSKFGNFN